MASDPDQGQRRDGEGGTPHSSAYQWRTLDRDLGRLSRVEYATMHVSRPLVGMGISLSFIVVAAIVALVVTGTSHGMIFVVAAAAFGAYMALNIGANDVANNMGPAVGANALPMAGAIALAAICESAGALIAGADVVTTISSNIIAPGSVTDSQTFIWAMLSALLSAAIWINIATWFSAPVSTTHAVVGGVLGAGIAAAGLSAPNWPTVAAIAASWMASPILGGIIAAAMLAFIKWRIIYREDKIAAARVWAPVLIGLMAAAFATYLALKGAGEVAEGSLGIALTTGLGAGLLVYLLAVPVIRRQSRGMENRNRSLKALFAFPLVLSAALLSFAHGANDVANAVGPLAAIVHAQQSGGLTGEIVMPLWVLLIGACGISFGLVLFGPRLIRMVGSQITKLNPMRAYCVSLSAAVTVIFASWLGMPVSSTHIAVGGVFGVGLYREWYMERRARRMSNSRTEARHLAPEERRRRKLVRRSHFLTIIAAWIITVPAAALMSAGVFLLLTTIVA